MAVFNAPATFTVIDVSRWKKDKIAGYFNFFEEEPESPIEEELDSALIVADNVILE